MAGFFGIIAVQVLLESRNIDHSGWPEVIGLLVWLGVKLLCLDAPRLRSLCWSPWWLLLFFFPPGYFVLQILLFTRPPYTTLSSSAAPDASYTGALPPPIPSSVSGKSQTIPTFIYAIAFVPLFIVQLMWAIRAAQVFAHGDSAIAIGYVQGQTVIPLVIIAAIASIWRANRGFRGVVRVLCYTSLICVALKFTTIAGALHARAARPQNTAVPAVPAVLTAADKKTLLKDAGITMEDFNKSGSKTVLSHTPDELFTVFSKESIEQQARAVMSNNISMKFLITEFHDPTNTFQTGKELVCFLPRTSMVQVNKRQFRSVAYWVAVRKNGNPEWKFIDGSGFQDDPQILWRVFPGLPGNLQLPEYKQELTD